jgi:Smr domain
MESPSSLTVRSSSTLSSSTTWRNVLHPPTTKPRSRDSEIDSYAQQLLHQLATEEASSSIDDCLGSYITSSLRTHFSRQPGRSDGDDDDVTESLVELIQEHCDVSESAALSCLRKISETVSTGRVPDVRNGSDRASSNDTLSSLALPLLTTPQSLPEPSGTQEGAETPAGGSIHESNNPTLPESALSPLAADNLIPVDLLDEEDDDGDDDEHRAAEDAIASVDTSPKAFPPLGSDDEGSTKMKKLRLHTRKNHKPSNSRRSKSVEADELAAALFQSTRSRQSSIDESTSPNLQPLVAPPPSSLPRSGMHHPNHQMQMTAEFLLAMNADLSDDAAYAAAVLGQGDANVAQYVIEAALSQAPICRHMLADGCYRADCQFSHETETHTCLFWLRKFCSKGVQCKFLHGLADKLLQDLPDMSSYYDYPGSDADVADNNIESYEYSGYGNGEAHNYYNSTVSHNSSWIPSPPPSGSSAYAGGQSFAKVATHGYDTGQSFVAGSSSSGGNPALLPASGRAVQNLPTTRIPIDLWNPHENRDATAFHIVDPLERYYTVAGTGLRDDVIDLHFQSVKTFGAVIDTILPMKLANYEQAWIVTGTGHHVGRRTHQKGGGALEQAVLEYLVDNYSEYYGLVRGRDHTGQGGAVLVKRDRGR